MTGSIHRRRTGGARAAALALACGVGLSHPVAGQTWNAPRATELARRAVERRTGQIADSSLAAYSAKATGYLTFLAQVGDTAIIPPMVIRQDQLAVEVYWRAPASSKQIVVGRRDTLLMPADIDYYRDRFGIVQSNFPDRIRLGDGRDVADVPHPLGSTALEIYDFAITDSLSLDVVGERIDVYQVAFRPRDARQPRAVGSVFLDVRNADIVRIELAFTRSAVLDRRIEHLTVVLENQLIEGRFWLPRRQYVEVVRAPPQIALPVRGIIRGWWDVCCYDVTFAPPVTLFTGAPIAFAAPSALRAYPFEGGILDGLPPDVAVARPEDITKVQERAQSLVSQAFRERVQRAVLAVPRIGDVMRVTRAEGLALGAAAELRLRDGLRTDGRVRFGFSDEEWKGELGFSVDVPGLRPARAFARSDYVDVRDVAEASSVRNTIAAQEFGSDYTDPIHIRAAGMQIALGRRWRTHWRLEIAYEKHAPLIVQAAPENGRYEALLPARRVEGARLSVRGDGASWSLGGGTIHASGEARAADYDVPALRLAIVAAYERRMGRGRVATRTVAAAVSGGDVAPQLGVYFGGPVTAPGYRFDEFAARRGISQHLEWRTQVPFIPVPLGRFGRVPPHATLAPFVHLVWVDDPLMLPGNETAPEPTPPYAFRGTRRGSYPALGAAVEPLMGLVRIDVARGLREGRWTFSLDVTRAFWPLL